MPPKRKRTDQDSDAAQAGSAKQGSLSPASKRPSRRPSKPPVPARPRFVPPPAASSSLVPLTGNRVQTVPPVGGKAAVDWLYGDMTRLPREELRPSQPAFLVDKTGPTQRLKKIELEYLKRRRGVPQQTSAINDSEHETRDNSWEPPLVHTQEMTTTDVENQPILPDTFQVQQLVSDDMVGGLVFIPVRGAQPWQYSDETFIMFTVMEGAVLVQIHVTSFVVAPMGMFWVPRGNWFCIENICERMVKLSYATAERLPPEEGSGRKTGKSRDPKPGPSREPKPGPSRGHKPGPSRGPKPGPSRGPKPGPSRDRKRGPSPDSAPSNGPPSPKRGKVDRKGKKKAAQ